jgi:hypothetical protein
VSHNKVLTRDNLAKRQNSQDKRCLFCVENETVEHLCFSCDVAKLVWTCISEIVKTHIGDSYENVARLWISNKKSYAINMITSAAVWNVWRMKNDIFFGRLIWSDIQMIWRRMAVLIRKWTPLCTQEKQMLGEWCSALDRKAREVPQLDGAEKKEDAGGC